MAARRRSDTDLLLLAWVGVTALVLYAPFALQRRFSLGLHIPLAILAAMGLRRLAKTQGDVRARRWRPHCPTTFLVIVLALGGGLKHDPRLFVSADEAAALDWLHDNTPRDAVGTGLAGDGNVHPGVVGPPRGLWSSVRDSGRRADESARRDVLGVKTAIPSAKRCCANGTRRSCSSARASARSA